MERLSSSHSGPVADPGFLSRLGSKCVGIAEHIIVPSSMEVCQIFQIMPTYDQVPDDEQTVRPIHEEPAMYIFGVH